MLSRTDSPREIRKRLLNPPNGRDSTELEIVGSHIHGREYLERSRRRRELDRAARQMRANELIEEYKLTLAAWVMVQDEAEPDFPEIPKISIKSIVDTVCGHFELAQTEVFSNRRQAKLVLARHVAIYLAKELTPLSYPQIGYYIGGLDHTSAIHAFQRIRDRITTDASVAEHVAALKAKLGVA